jgi:hypothetical protein
MAPIVSVVSPKPLYDTTRIGGPLLREGWRITVSGTETLHRGAD